MTIAQIQVQHSEAKDCLLMVLSTILAHAGVRVTPGKTTGTHTGPLQQSDVRF